MDIGNEVAVAVLLEAEKPFVLIRRGAYVDMEALRRALGGSWEIVMVGRIEDVAFFSTAWGEIPEPEAKAA